jgi:hypothetical protein
MSSRQLRKYLRLKMKINEPPPIVYNTLLAILDIQPDPPIDNIIINEENEIEKFKNLLYNGMLNYDDSYTLYETINECIYCLNPLYQRIENIEDITRFLNDFDNYKIKIIIKVIFYKLKYFNSCAEIESSMELFKECNINLEIEGSTYLLILELINMIIDINTEYKRYYPLIKINTIHDIIKFHLIEFKHYLHFLLYL